MQLKSTHHYYHQVQLQLYVSSDMFSWCDFCIFTTKGCLVTRITPDDQWVKDYVPQLKEYFENFMVDEILIPQLKPSYYIPVKCLYIYSIAYQYFVMLHI